MLSAPERRRKVMENGNAKAELERIRISVIENLRHLAHTPSARHPNPACIFGGFPETCEIKCNL